MARAVVTSTRVRSKRGAMARQGGRIETICVNWARDCCSSTKWARANIRAIRAIEKATESSSKGHLTDMREKLREVLCRQVCLE